ncbi:hypothetical protein DFH28DRAFT_490953 [Melampsora americana]|nr:hypothetical protein DFH28DRAFT_490953 [Melampsora americana]
MAYIGFVFNAPFWPKLTRKGRSRRSSPSSISSERSSNFSIESTPKPQRTKSFIHQGREPPRVLLYNTCRPLDSSLDPVYLYRSRQSQPSAATSAIATQVLHDSPELVHSEHHGHHSSIQAMFSLLSYEENDRKLVTNPSLLIGPNPQIENVEKSQIKPKLQCLNIPDHNDLESERSSPILASSVMTRERSNPSIDLQSYFEDDSKSETSSLADYQTEIECLPRSIFEDDSDDEEGSIRTSSRSRARSSSVGTTNTTSISIPSIVLSTPVGEDLRIVDQNRYRIDYDPNLLMIPSHFDRK